MSSKDSEIIRLEKIANDLKVKIIRMIAKSGIGHAGGSMSIAEIVAVLYFHVMRVNPENALDENRDRFILSKGHASATQYAALARWGIIPEDELWTLHHIDSRLQMHPERGLCPGIEMSTGALGQGLSAGIGMAIGANLKKKDFRCYVVLGDGELMEGQVWEAAMSAPKFKLDNLTAIVDYNKFSLTSRTKETMPLDPLGDKWKAFGWQVIEVDGHSVSQLVQAFDEAKTVKGKPTVIIAHTFKGHDIPALEDTAASHSVSFTKEQVEATLNHLGCSIDEINQTLSIMK
ncbi:MAG: hypothetical protein A2V66_15320 [Ignavibacteria bacterium RBG_13_36_8]|nr:MAG: hypothetical protein A2V66_15320 [Ignavibacteria bacterium RBG_13_36_8]